MASDNRKKLTNLKSSIESRIKSNENILDMKLRAALVELQSKYDEMISTFYPNAKNTWSVSTTLAVLDKKCSSSPLSTSSAAKRSANESSDKCVEKPMKKVCSFKDGVQMVPATIISAVESASSMSVEDNSVDPKHNDQLPEKVAQSEDPVVKGKGKSKARGKAKAKEMEPVVAEVSTEVEGQTFSGTTPDNTPSLTQLEMQLTNINVLVGKGKLHNVIPELSVPLLQYISSLPAGSLNPLHIALQNFSVDCVLFLVSCGLDIHSKANIYPSPTDGLSGAPHQFIGISAFNLFEKLVEANINAGATTKKGKFIKQLKPLLSTSSADSKAASMSALEKLAADYKKKKNALPPYEMYINCISAQEVSTDVACPSLVPIDAKQQTSQPDDVVEKGEVKERASSNEKVVPVVEELKVNVPEVVNEDVLTGTAASPVVIKEIVEAPIQSFATIIESESEDEGLVSKNNDNTLGATSESMSNTLDQLALSATLPESFAIDQSQRVEMPEQVDEIENTSSETVLVSAGEVTMEVKSEFKAESEVIEEEIDDDDDGSLPDIDMDDEKDEETTNVPEIEIAPLPGTPIQGLDSKSNENDDNVSQLLSPMVSSQSASALPLPMSVHRAIAASNALVVPPKVPTSSVTSSMPIITAQSLLTSDTSSMVSSVVSTSTTAAGATTAVPGRAPIHPSTSNAIATAQKLLSPVRHIDNSGPDFDSSKSIISVGASTVVSSIVNSFKPLAMPSSNLPATASSSNLLKGMGAPAPLTSSAVASTNSSTIPARSVTPASSVSSSTASVSTASGVLNKAQLERQKQDEVERERRERRDRIQAEIQARKAARAAPGSGASTASSVSAGAGAVGKVFSVGVGPTHLPQSLLAHSVANGTAALTKSIAPSQTPITANKTLGVLANGIARTPLLAAAVGASTSSNPASISATGTSSSINPALSVLQTPSSVISTNKATPTSTNSVGVGNSNQSASNSIYPTPTSISSVSSSSSSANAPASTEVKRASAASPMAPRSTNLSVNNAPSPSAAMELLKKKNSMILNQNPGPATTQNKVVPTYPSALTGSTHTNQNYNVTSTATNGLNAKSHSSNNLHVAPGKLLPNGLRVADHENYEMSDKESSDDDEDDDEDNGKPRKMIPEWARSAALKSALERQFGPNGPDPDKIFPEVQTCNLDEIFTTKEKYKKRTSSGDWMSDRLTANEKKRYREAMGWK